ncbi:tRNA (guanine(46)-N(7))-methyltransferase TrmB [Vreelandella alkaliphila]|uniref:tRNA (guanine(46)-N(7))-methyltransferase n=1 Tax=Vreelandella alkaliphila TaxID=272774 RepID=A0AAJ2RT31_9GAMM|nr:MULTISPECIES: methyltransferase domain-containing protein [Halomonas]AIA73785.1 SAM-dependent methyltransferase [Halomonas campaniensis]MCD6439716.1 methyltransferase domain-containing protein [Halomonas sp.]MDX5977282.1 methyltransferase domain-containing protein [Halomonas alkaliphila]PAU70618.1 SAM-dependent methyltransferase [Halomonas humidisoli]
MQHTSRPVVSNQPGPHHDVARRVARALENPLRKPIAAHTQKAFEDAHTWLQKQQAPLILDAGCGVGLSTRRLAEQFPAHAVIGVDRSEDRLSRDHGELPANALLVRADLVDFWRLAEQEKWAPERHFLLYPNPYPKAAHLKMRWHGHPVFPTLLALGGHLEVRSNWQLYVEEFALATALVTGKQATIAALVPNGSYLTPFEAKYDQSGQTLWQLQIKLERA